MVDQPATPTPRKPRQRRGVKPSTQRRQNGGAATGALSDNALLAQEQAYETSSDDEEMLFDLLGVASPLKAPPAPNNATATATATVPTAKQEKGVLSLPQEDMDQALGRQRKPRRKNDRSGLTDSEIEQKARGQRNEGSPAPAPSRRGGRANKQSGMKGTEEDKDVVSENDVPRTKEKGRRGKKASRPPIANEGYSNDTLEIDGTTPRQEPHEPSPSASGISATRPPKGASTKARMQAVLTSSGSSNPHEEAVPTASDSFDVTSLSRSLPSSGFAQPTNPKTVGKGRQGKRADGGDDSAVWEMPEVAGGQELTWQQKLQAQTTDNATPRRNAKSTPSDRKSKTRATQAAPSVPANQRPAHNRRLSLDALPSSSSISNSTSASLPPSGPTATPSAQVAAGRTFSAFDSHIPFHTGFNVHRAPQTPAKGVASANGNLLKQSGAVGGGDINLPIVGSGEFPRLPGFGTSTALERKGSGGPATQAQAVMGAKYAGPTFHNSPHAASLPKPDLEDF